MSLPTRDESIELLHKHVTDTYQRYHALMVGTAMEGYAKLRGEDPELWFLTGYLHDLDYDQYPAEHPGPSLQWFHDWSYPDELIHAVEAHANGFNGFTTKPETDLAKALIACDEICGIFYAYHKLNPIPFGEMKAKSIKKRLKERKFAPGIDRDHILNGVADFGITIDEHVEHLINSLGTLPTPAN